MAKSKKPTEFNLSSAQVKAFDTIMDWHKNGGQTFTLAGYAGTGKTTLAKYIAARVPRTIFCAYTGKAANVLREKGCDDAKTVHGTIYKLSDPDASEPVFVLNHDSEATLANLVIVDEYSMLPKEITDDLERLGKKILYLGDPFQLPPVQGECHIKPDLFLTEVHRQALDSPIIRYATAVRNGETISYCDEGEFVYKPRSLIDREVFTTADQVICGYNDTRHAWNDRFRLLKGYTGEFPNKGEKLICLKNNHQKGLYNGMIGKAGAKAKKDGFERLRLDFDEFKKLKVWTGDFTRTKDPIAKGLRYLDRFDFAYVITCHKSQGSEFDNVALYREPIGRTAEERQRWIYTGITRAKKKLTMIDPHN